MAEIIQIVIGIGCMFGAFWVGVIAGRHCSEVEEKKLREAEILADLHEAATSVRGMEIRLVDPDDLERHFNS